MLSEQTRPALNGYVARRREKFQRSREHKRFDGVETLLDVLEVVLTEFRSYFQTKSFSWKFYERFSEAMMALSSVIAGSFQTMTVTNESSVF